jgi:hypothetical protein
VKTFLDWRYATKADLSLRKAFVCTNPEVEAQAEVLPQVIAVAMRYRHRDGSVAKELVAQTASRIEQKALAAGARNLLVEDRVDFRNLPGKRLLKFAGFEYEGRRDELEIWTYARDFSVGGL